MKVRQLIFCVKRRNKALERSDRITGQGIVASYIHTNNKIGVLVQFGCETDCVARNPDFRGSKRYCHACCCDESSLYFTYRGYAGVN